MKTQYILLTLTSLMLLASCGGKANSSTSEDSSSTSQSSESSSSSSDSSSESSGLSSASTGTVTPTSTPSSGDTWFDDKTYLECGSYSVGYPKNSEAIVLPTDNDSSSFVTYDTTTSVDAPLRYIYKNSIDDGPTNHKCGVSMYSSSSGGGVKFTNVGVGLQTPLFSHTGFKLEIRIGISQVNNASGTPDKKDPIHIYYFNKNNEYLGKGIVSDGSITTSTAKNYVRVYCQEDYVKDVAWFEVRLNAQPYKGSQCYNIGVNYLSIKSWLGSN